MSESVSSQPARRATGARIIVIAPLILFLLLAGLFLIRLFAGDPARLPSAMTGRPVPDFALPPLAGLVRDGAPVPGLDAASLRQGRRAIVNVFASWCVPCHEEHPLLMQLATDPALFVTGVAYKDDPDNARRFLGSKGNPFSRVGVDRNGRAMIDWGVYGVPETFVVDASGAIIHKHIGPLNPEALAKIRAVARN